MIKVKNNPIDWIVEIANEIYSGSNHVDVIFVDREDMDYIVYKNERLHVEKLKPEDIVYGATSFNETTDQPEHIYISSDIEFTDILSVLAHECAHVIAGIKVEHGEEFEKSLDLIHDKYMEKFEKWHAESG